MRRTPANDYLEDISTELPEEIYGYLSDAIYETVCEFDEEVDQLKAENAKLQELVWTLANCAAGHGCDYCPINGGYGYVGEHDMCESVHTRMRELGIEVDE